MEAAELQAAFREELIAAGYLIPTGVDGVYGRSEDFEDIAQRVSRRITAHPNCRESEFVHFPPVLSRAVLEKTGYMESMPQLCGCVHSFLGDDAQHAELLQAILDKGDWGQYLGMTQVSLTPAACYPIYPMNSEERIGRLPEGGKRFDLTSWVFRHEPSIDPARMQNFRQREMVRLGSQEDVLEWRESWKVEGHALLAQMGLDVEIETANDPFFGRRGRLMKKNQRALELKFEVGAQIYATHRTAVASFNYHESHFGDMFGIVQHDGTTAHTACLGFGLERITLALLRTHGMDVDAWPAEARKELGF